MLFRHVTFQNACIMYQYYLVLCFNQLYDYTMYIVICVWVCRHTRHSTDPHTHTDMHFQKNHSGKLAKYHLMLFDQHERWCSACRDVMLVAISYLPNLCLLFACAYWLANGKTHIHAINWLTKPTTHSMFQINVH